MNPLREPGPYAQAVADACVARKVDVLLPVTDASVDAILERRTLVPRGTVLPFASLDAYRAASDKVHVQRLASELGIGVPGSVVVDDPRSAAPDDPRLYPGVVKPHRSVVGKGVRFKTRVELVRDRAQCEAALRRLPPEAFPVLVQPRLRGAGEGYFIARWEGRTVARFAHRRLREKPPSGGVSVFRESIAADAVVLEACERLLDRLGWQGVAMIEGKRDLDRDGWSVMEINGRFWGSLQLAIDAGVDFPRLLVEAAEDGRFAEPPSWRVGTRTRWEWGDVDHLLLRLVRSRERLDLPASAPGRMRAVLAFLRHTPAHDRLEVLRWRDPFPFLLESARRLRLAR